MKIFDCFMYFDEDLVLELRLNYLSKFVDHFVIVESKFNHKGEERELKFDLRNFKEFQNNYNSNPTIDFLADRWPKGLTVLKINLQIHNPECQEKP